DTAKDAAAAAAGARALAMAIGRTYTGTLLLQQAEWDASSGRSSAEAAAAAERWCGLPAAPMCSAREDHREASRSLLDDTGN
ncbi:MAG: hypothetical protein ACRETX_13145, partial [Steroidobacteraceae bacterium]